MSEVSTSKKLNARALLLWIAVTAIVLLGALASFNFFSNPLTFRESSLHQVAVVLAQGKNFAIADPNIDFRGLRREQIALMTAKPDVVLFAGSRFELASHNSFPGRTFYNAFAHNDYFEDLLAITGLLDENNKLPKTLVLSIRHLSFVPVSKRATDEWKRFSPEYQRMARRLGVSVGDMSDSIPYGHYRSLLSTEYLKHGYEISTLNASIPYGETDLETAEDRDILHADGSFAFSRKHTGTASPESARAEALMQAKRLSNGKATLPDDADAKLLEQLFQYLIARGVQPVIAITPHHPAFWEAIANESYGRSLFKLEARVKELAQKSHVAFVGSFDPKVAGCQESSFRDYIHLDERCLKIIFNQIPPPRAPSV